MKYPMKLVRSLNRLVTDLKSVNPYLTLHRALRLKWHQASSPLFIELDKAIDLNSGEIDTMSVNYLLHEYNEVLSLGFLDFREEAELAIRKSYMMGFTQAFKDVKVPRVAPEETHIDKILKAFSSYVITALISHFSTAVIPTINFIIRDTSVLGGGSLEADKALLNIVRDPIYHWKRVSSVHTGRARIWGYVGACKMLDVSSVIVVGVSEGCQVCQLMRDTKISMDTLDGIHWQMTRASYEELRTVMPFPRYDEVAAMLPEQKAEANFCLPVYHPFCTCSIMAA